MTENFDIDLNGLGYRELEMLKDLIDAYLKSDWKPDNLFAGFNPDSGNVFLYNPDNFETYMIEDGKLERYYSTELECGHEGFIEEL